MPVPDTTDVITESFLTRRQPQHRQGSGYVASPSPSGSAVANGVYLKTTVTKFGPVFPSSSLAFDALIERLHLLEERFHQ